MREAGHRRCGAMLACMHKLQGRIAGMPRDAANFWAGVRGYGGRASCCPASLARAKRRSMNAYSSSALASHPRSSTLRLWNMKPRQARTSASLSSSYLVVGSGESSTLGQPEASS